jgi:hypothetical protein
MKLKLKEIWLLKSKKLQKNSKTNKINEDFLGHQSLDAGVKAHQT